MISSSNQFAVSIAAPAPAPGISPIGTIATVGQSVTTAQGTWSFDPANMGSGGNVLLLNGKPAGGSGIKFVVSVDGLKVLNNVGNWYLWIVSGAGGGWIASVAP